MSFQIEKKFAEFEQLRNKISETFSATVIPAINKKGLLTNDTVLKERRNSLNTLMKFFAASEKISTSFPLLEFLGNNLFSFLYFALKKLH